MLMSPNKGETAVHGCHCPGDMAVRMLEVLARPWIGVCVPLSFITPPPPLIQPVIGPPLVPCIEMNSTFYDVFELKKAIKFKKSFDQHFYVACFETTFFSSVIKPLPRL